ncbi:hypothetical protein O9929_15155 [Vibrio lentus]|nr:hypothetical protein [Vibrio lentus]
MTSLFFHETGLDLGKDMGEKFSIVATNGAIGLVLVLLIHRHDPTTSCRFLGIGFYPILCVRCDDGSANRWG